MEGTPEERFQKLKLLNETINESVENGDFQVNSIDLRNIVDDEGNVIATIQTAVFYSTKKHQGRY